MRPTLGTYLAVLVLLVASYGLYRSLPASRVVEDLSGIHSPAFAPLPPPERTEPTRKRRLRMRNTLRPLWSDEETGDDSLPPRMVPVLLRPGDTALELAHQLYSDVPDAGGDSRAIGGRRLLMALTFELNGADDPNRIQAGRRILFYNTAAMSLTVDASEGTLVRAVHFGRLALDSALVILEGKGAGDEVEKEIERLSQMDPRYFAASLYLVVANRTNSPQRAYIPCGRGVEVEDVSSNAQHFLVAETCSLHVGPYEVTRTLVPVVCLNRPKEAPKPGTPVALTVLRTTGSLHRALEDPPTMTQLAVWHQVAWMREKGLERLAQTTGRY